MSTRCEQSEVREWRVPAPAKVNLTLAVLSRRSDGYHEIDSLFVPIDLYDDVRVVRLEDERGKVRLRCSDPLLPSDSQNLAWRAVEEFYRDRSSRPSFAIAIGKHIPVGAGLGGGSSDAAAVLRALARFEAVADPSPALFDCALRVGADVPFFLWNRPARVRGVGEIIEPLEKFSELWLAVVFPGHPVSTRWAYEQLDRSLTSPGAADTMRRFRLRDQDLTEIFNDFEGVVAERFPEILAVKARLVGWGAYAAGLSGSGSAVFGIFHDGEGAERAAAAARSEGLWAVSARTLTAPPPLR